MVSLLSRAEMAIEDVAHLISYANTRLTEPVCRKESRPALTRGTRAKDTHVPAWVFVGWSLGDSNP